MGSSQVVGWPPIRAYRMNSMANQAKSIATGEHSIQFEESKRKDVIYASDDKGNAKSKDRIPVKSSLFVKVNMDGVAIGRKVDLNAHPSYESLAQTLEEMFSNKAVASKFWPLCSLGFCFMVVSVNLIPKFRFRILLSLLVVELKTF